MPLKRCSTDPRPGKETAMPGIHATQPRLATPVFVLVAIVGAMLGAPAPAAALDFDSFAGDHKAAADNAADVVVLANGTITPPPPPPPGLGSPPRAAARTGDTATAAARARARANRLGRLNLDPPKAGGPLSDRLLILVSGLGMGVSAGPPSFPMSRIYAYRSASLQSVTERVGIGHLQDGRPDQWVLR